MKCQSLSDLFVVQPGWSLIHAWLLSQLSRNTFPHPIPLSNLKLSNQFKAGRFPAMWLGNVFCFLASVTNTPKSTGTHTHALQFLWERPSNAQITFKDLEPDWFHEPYNAFPSWTTQTSTVHYTPLCACPPDKLHDCVCWFSYFGSELFIVRLLCKCGRHFVAGSRRPKSTDEWPLHNIITRLAVVQSIVSYCCHANTAMGGGVEGETDLLDWNDSQITKSHSFSP